MKWVKKSVLSEAGYYKLKVGSAVPSFCDSCGLQRTHVVVATGVFDRDFYFKLACSCCGIDKEVD